MQHDWFMYHLRSTYKNRPDFPFKSNQVMISSLRPISGTNSGHSEIKPEDCWYSRGQLSMHAGSTPIAIFTAPWPGGCGREAGNCYACIAIYSVSKKKEKRKGNRDSILNLSKSKRQITKLLLVDDSIFIILWYGTKLAAQQPFFVKHVKTLVIQVLSKYTKQCGCINCCFVVKTPANAITQHKQRLLGQNQFWHVLQNCHVQPSLAPIKFTMYQIEVDDKLCYHEQMFLLYLLSILRNLESNPGFLLRNSIKLLY